MGEWRSTTIGALCDAGIADLQTGPFGSQLHAHDYVEEGVPVVPTEAIRNRRIENSVLPKIPKQKAEELSRHLLRPGDILFARRGVQATGHVAYVKPEEDGFICGTGAIRLRAERPSGVDPEFLSHLLSDTRSVEWFKFHAIGATMPNLNEGIIRAFPLRLPPLAEQHAIAQILTALDDRVQVNYRIGATLEAMARALFKSWFVDFEPVRAKSEGRGSGLADEIVALFPERLVESRVGRIPDGWTVGVLTALIEVNPRRSLSKGVVAPYLDMANMPTSGHAPNEVVNRPFGSGMRFMNGDTLVARITPCLENGKTAFVDFLDDGQIGWGSTEYIVLRPRQHIPAEFGYLLARDERFRDFAVQHMTGTSGRQRVSATALAHYELVSPPGEPVFRAFGELIRPLLKRSSRALSESRILEALRDALLPKLVSGELRVTNAERVVETVV